MASVIAAASSLAVSLAPDSTTTIGTIRTMPTTITTTTMAVATSCSGASSRVGDGGSGRFRFAA